MTVKLDKSTANNDVGLYWKTSRRVKALPAEIGELATGILATAAGTLVWENEEGEAQVTIFEAGQWLPCAAVKILSSATIDGTLETTLPITGWLWTASPLNLGKAP
jgi:hypothetical protein